MPLRPGGSKLNQSTQPLWANSSRTVPACVFCFSLILIVLTAGLLLVTPSAAQIETPFLLEGEWTTIANGDDVRDVMVSGDTAWAATRYGGVVRWDLSAGDYQQYLAPQTGLAGNDVRAVASDGQGRLWFATHSPLAG